MPTFDWKAEMDRPHDPSSPYQFKDAATEYAFRILECFANNTEDKKAATILFSACEHLSEKSRED